MVLSLNFSTVYDTWSFLVSCVKIKAQTHSDPRRLRLNFWVSPNLWLFSTPLWSVYNDSSPFCLLKNPTNSWICKRNWLIDIFVQFVQCIPWYNFFLLFPAPELLWLILSPLVSIKFMSFLKRENKSKWLKHSYII